MAANDSQAPAPECMLDVRHLRKRFGPKTVLEDVSFTVERGTICVVMGGSGSGKSTVLRHLIGAYKPDSGEIYLDGEEITHLDERDLQPGRRKFGMLFQGGELLNSLTVGENIDLRIADKMIMLHRCRIVAAGTPDEIRESPDPLVQQFITGAPDGPIPLRMSQKEYQEDILGL